MLKCEVIKIIDPSTIKVSFTNVFIDPICRKVIRRKKKFLCHTNNIEVNVGDVVEVKQSKSFSKNKNKIVVNVL